MLKAMLGASYKTSLGAIFAVIGALLMGLSLTFDNDPKTTTDWNDMMRLFGELTVALGAASGLFAARDNNVSSAQAKASPKM